MALNRIIADSIADGTVVASDIADGTITLAKLQSGLLPPAIANSGAAYANSAFATANTVANNTTIASSYANSAFASANAATATDATQNTNITNVGTYANSAFSKANSVVTSILAGTGISVSGATGDVTVSATTGGVTSLNGQTGAVTTTSVNDIGSVMLLALYASTFTAYYSGQTVSGSILYYSNAIAQYNNTALTFNGSNTGAGNNEYTSPAGSGAFGMYIQRNQSGNVGRQLPQGMTACTGTWRLMSPVGAGGQSSYDGDNNITANLYYVSLWVRVS
jgi:hypothetical protein